MPLIKSISKAIFRLRPSVLYGLLGFAVVRAVTGLVIAAATRLTLAVGRPIGPCSHLSRLALTQSGRFGYLLAAWERWDTCHYLLLSQLGYTGHVQQSVWPPLYPALIAAAGWLFKPPLLAALVISNLAALACFILFYELVAGRWGDALARKSVWLLAVYPTAFYLVAGYTESLALSFALACFLALRKRRWVWAGIWAGLATLTRQQGVLLIAPMLALAYTDWRRSGAEGHEFKLPPVLLGLGLPALAFAGFSLFVHFGLRSPWPWVTLEAFWKTHTAWPWEGIFGNLSLLAGHTLGIPSPYKFNLVALVADLLLACLCVYWLIDGRRLPAEYLVYSWALLLVALAKVEASSALMSVSRYTLSIFPIFVAQALRINRKWALWSFCAASALAQIALLVCFYRWIWVA
jgi:hypothetical protein